MNTPPLVANYNDSLRKVAENLLRDVRFKESVIGARDHEIKILYEKLAAQQKQLVRYHEEIERLEAAASPTPPSSRSSAQTPESSSHEGKAAPQAP